MKETKAVSRTTAVAAAALAIAAVVMAIVMAMPADQAHAAVGRSKVYRDNTNNCVLWARKQVPSLPTGLTYYSGKQRICNLSGSATPHKGDVAVINTGKANGHVAVVTGASGGKVTIRESNWTKGWVTQATGSASALSIFGYYCPKGSGHTSTAPANTTQASGSVAGKYGHNPIGYLDTCTAGMGQITVSGWTFDPDSPSASINVHVYVDNHAVANLRADQSSADVTRVYGVGGAHRFQATIKVGDTGKHTVRAYGINTGAGCNWQLTNAKTVTIPVNNLVAKYGHNPMGYLDEATGGKGTINVRGWTFDPDSPSASLNVHIYIDGKPLANLLANQSSADVTKVFGVGGSHRFQATIKVGERGKHTIRAYGINQGAGCNWQLTNSKTVSISG